MRIHRPDEPRAPETMKPADLTPNERRAERYDSEFIACIRHPERRCNRSAYVRRNSKSCASCRNRHANGQLQEGYKRRHRLGTARYRQTENGKERHAWRERLRRNWQRIVETRI